MYNFNLMANYSAAFLDKTKEVPLELARRKYARPTTEMIKKAQGDSITFLIVRHPLERLASAYNDKIVHAWPKSFHDKMGHRIIKKYRKVRNFLCIKVCCTDKEANSLCDVGMMSSVAIIWFHV